MKRGDPQREKPGAKDTGKPTTDSSGAAEGFVVSSMASVSLA
jgi:hypothetical protein